MSENFAQYSESFKQQQKRVQDAYGDDTEIYKTLNPKHSQAQIKPQNQRHEESKKFIEKKMGSKLFSQLYEMLELELQQETDPLDRQQMVKEICGGNKELISLCQKLEEIIFMEQNFTYD